MEYCQCAHSSSCTCQTFPGISYVSMYQLTCPQLFPFLFPSILENDVEPLSQCGVVCDGNLIQLKVHGKFGHNIITVNLMMMEIYILINNSKLTTLLSYLMDSAANTMPINVPLLGQLFKVFVHAIIFLTSVNLLSSR